MARRSNQNLKRGSSESALIQAKKQLCERFLNYLKKNGISQRELAVILETDESVVSKILHQKTDEFTTDFLVKKLNSIYSDLEIKIATRE